MKTVLLKGRWSQDSVYKTIRDGFNSTTLKGIKQTNNGRVYLLTSLNRFGVILKPQNNDTLFSFKESFFISQTALGYFLSFLSIIFIALYGIGIIFLIILWIVEAVNEEKLRKELYSFLSNANNSSVRSSTNEEVFRTNSSYNSSTNQSNRIMSNDFTLSPAVWEFKRISKKYKLFIDKCAERFSNNDWGDIEKDDANENDKNLKNKSDIIRAFYILPDEIEQEFDQLDDDDKIKDKYRDVYSDELLIMHIFQENKTYIMYLSEE